MGVRSEFESHLDGLGVNGVFDWGMFVPGVIRRAGGNARKFAVAAVLRTEARAPHQDGREGPQKPCVQHWQSLPHRAGAMSERQSLDRIAGVEAESKTGAHH